MHYFSPIKSNVSLHHLLRACFPELCLQSLSIITITHRFTYQVYILPEELKARENWAPQSTLQIPNPVSFSTTWGTEQPSLPPRPSLPKSPSPQDQTQPSRVRQIVWASRLPQDTSITRRPTRPFTCQIRVR